MKVRVLECILLLRYVTTKTALWLNMATFILVSLFVIVHVNVIYMCTGIDQVTHSKSSHRYIDRYITYLYAM